MPQERLRSPWWVVQEDGTEAPGEAGSAPGGVADDPGTPDVVEEAPGGGAEEDGVLTDPWLWTPWLWTCARNPECGGLTLCCCCSEGVGVQLGLLLEFGNPWNISRKCEGRGRVLGVSLEFFFAQMGGVLTQELPEKDEGSEDQTAAV